METCVWKDSRYVDEFDWIRFRDGEQAEVNINTSKVIDDGIRERLVGSKNPDIVHEALKHRWGLQRREVVFVPNHIAVVPSFTPEPMVVITRFFETCMMKHIKDL